MSIDIFTLVAYLKSVHLFDLGFVVEDHWRLKAEYDATAANSRFGVHAIQGLINTCVAGFKHLLVDLEKIFHKRKFSQSLQSVLS